MAKKKPETPIRSVALKEVKITANPIKRQSPDRPVALYPKGTVPKSKVDSLRKVGYGSVIGKPFKGTGGMDTYGANDSDVIKRALKPKQKAQTPVLAKLTKKK